MRLAASNGNAVMVRIDGYQFPDIVAPGQWDHDANWLMVSGQIVDGSRSWSFRDPCLLTWEGRELADWLRGVAEGATLPDPIDPGGDGERGDLAFTEPNLSFHLHHRISDTATIRVRVSHEALPLAASPCSPAHHVELPMTSHDVAVALDEWEAELRRFPPR